MTHPHKKRKIVRLIPRRPRKFVKTNNWIQEPMKLATGIVVIAVGLQALKLLQK